MSEFTNVKFPILGSKIRQIFGRRVYGCLYTFWTCIRQTFQQTITNDYWRSAFHGKPFSDDRSGKLTPWYSYPAIAYLRRLSWAGKTIVEVGGGCSTTWWADRAWKVVTIDNDAEWLNFDKRPNVTGILVKTINDMASEVVKHRADVYIIDNAGDRNGIIDAVLAMDLTGCMVILDNAEFYEEAADKLTRKSKQWVSFEGVAPGFTRDITSVWWF